MKKVVFLLAITVVIGLRSGYSQENQADFRFGFKISPNFGWMKSTATGYSSEGVAVGVSWGFMGEYNLAKNYAIASGFNVTANSGKLKYPGIFSNSGVNVEGTMHRKYNLKYLEIPATLKMKTNQIGYLTYFGQIGFGTSLNLSARSKDEFNVTTTGATYKSDENIKDDVKFIRESLIIGLGAEYTPGGSVTFLGSLMFNNGLTDVLKKKNQVNTGVNEDAITNYIELNLGILF